MTLLSWGPQSWAMTSKRQIWGDRALRRGADGRDHVGLYLALRQRAIVDADIVHGAGDMEAVHSAADVDVDRRISLRVRGIVRGHRVRVRCRGRQASAGERGAARRRDFRAITVDTVTGHADVVGGRGPR